MRREVVEAVCERLVEQAGRQETGFAIVLHGGEPLLLGFDGLAALLRGLRAHLSPDRHPTSIQTNGMLLGEDLLDLFAETRTSVSVSIDGPSEANDLARLDHRGRSTYAATMRGIQCLAAHSESEFLFAGTLSVIQPAVEPRLVYEFLKALGTPNMDFLLQDGNHDRLPPGKSGFDSTEYGRWLMSLLDLYLADPSPVPIRLLDDTIKLCLGGTSRKEGSGTGSVWNSDRRDGRRDPQERHAQSLLRRCRPVCPPVERHHDASVAGALIAGVRQVYRDAGTDVQCVRGLRSARRLRWRNAPVPLERQAWLRQSIGVLPRSRGVHSTCRHSAARIRTERISRRIPSICRCFLSWTRSLATACPSSTSRGRSKLPSNGNAWLDWFETDAPWKLTTAEFYEQYEFSLLDASLPPVVRCLASPETRTVLRHRMSECFRQPLSERVEVTAHKLVPDQTIRIHNDYIAGGESHRLLLQLNRGWEPENGGYLMFFGGPEPETVSEVVEPINGSVQAFAISPSPTTPSARFIAENVSPWCTRSIRIRMRVIEFIEGPCCWDRRAPARLREQVFGDASAWKSYSTSRCLDGSNPDILYTIECSGHAVDSVGERRATVTRACRSMGEHRTPVRERSGLERHGVPAHIGEFSGFHRHGPPARGNSRGAVPIASCTRRLRQRLRRELQ